MKDNKLSEEEYDSGSLFLNMLHEYCHILDVLGADQKQVLSLGRKNVEGIKKGLNIKDYKEYIDVSFEGYAITIK